MSTIFADKFKNTSGGNNIKVNQLSGIDTAGSILVTGEGGSTATNLQQGLSKCWVRWNGTGTPTNNDSLGVSSITDINTGIHEQTFTNAFSNTSMNIVTGIGELAGGGNRGIGIERAPTTTTTRFYTFYFPSSGGTAANDETLNSAAWQGDLA
jgi:hypothetical protein